MATPARPLHVVVWGQYSPVAVLLYHRWSRLLRGAAVLASRGEACACHRTAGASGFTGRLVCEHLVRDYKVRLRSHKILACKAQLLLDGPNSSIVPACPIVPCLPDRAGRQVGDGWALPEEDGASAPGSEQRVQRGLDGAPPGRQPAAPPPPPTHAYPRLLFPTAPQDIPILTADLSDQASLDKVAGQAAVVLSTAGPFARIGEPVVDAAVRMGSHYVDITGETPWVKQMIDKHHEQAKAKGLRIVPCCGYDSVPAGAPQPAAAGAAAPGTASWAVV